MLNSTCLCIILSSFLFPIRFWWSSEGPQGQRRLQSNRRGAADCGKLAAFGAYDLGHGGGEVHLLADIFRVVCVLPRVVVRAAHHPGLAIFRRRESHHAAQRGGGLRRTVGEAAGRPGGKRVLEGRQPRCVARLEKTQLSTDGKYWAKLVLMSSLFRGRNGTQLHDGRKRRERLVDLLTKRWILLLI